MSEIDQVLQEPPQIPGCLPDGYTLDSMVTQRQFALWLGVSLRSVSSMVSAGSIPVVRESRSLVRIHPRTYLASRGLKTNEEEYARTKRR